MGGRLDVDSKGCPRQPIVFFFFDKPQQRAEDSDLTTPLKGRPDGKVAYLQTWWGAHDVGLVEGVQDYMAEMFSMG
jgi:hypothetical protein